MHRAAFQCWRTCQRRAWNPAQSCTRWDQIGEAAICFIWKDENSWCLSIQSFICLFSLFLDFLMNVRCLGWKINWKRLFDGWQAGFNLIEGSATAFTCKTQSGLWHILTGGHFRWIIIQLHNSKQHSVCKLFDHSHTVECVCTQMGKLAMFFI